MTLDGTNILRAESSSAICAVIFCHDPSSHRLTVIEVTMSQATCWEDSPDAADLLSQFVIRTNEHRQAESATCQACELTMDVRFVDLRDTLEHHIEHECE